MDPSLFAAFSLLAEAEEAVLFGSGHIHDTYKVSARSGTYLLQRFNHHVFQQPGAVSENIQRVCQHLQPAMQALYPQDWARHLLQVIPTQSGSSLYLDSEGRYWRAFHFQEGTYTVDEVATPEQAFQAAKAFGEFARLLFPLEAASFHETIPGFHHIGRRFDNFLRAATEKALPSEAKHLVEKAYSVRPFVEEVTQLLHSGRIPLRLVHNDTKINNVLLDSQRHQGLCVIDLDTVMPGYLLYDFGDMVRTFVSPSREDTVDPKQILVRREIYEALCQGFLSEIGPYIDPVERASLYVGARLLPLLMALRFLTDYLEGNHYYKIHYPRQNLDRAFNQFHLYDLLSEQEAELRPFTL